MGEISFSFYMIHQLVIRYVDIANDGFMWDLHPYLLAGLMFGISLLLAVVLHKLVEVPANSLIKRKYRLIVGGSVIQNQAERFS